MNYNMLLKLRIDFSIHVLFNVRNIINTQDCMCFATFLHAENVLEVKHMCKTSGLSIFIYLTRLHFFRLIFCSSFARVLYIFN